MRTLLVAFIVLVMSASAGAETYPLRDHSRLTLVTPADWNESHGDVVGDLLFGFAPKNPKLNARCELTVSAGVVDEYDTKRKLSRYVPDTLGELRRGKQWTEDRGQWTEDISRRLAFSLREIGA